MMATKVIGIENDLTKVLFHIQKEIAYSNRFKIYKEMREHNYISEDTYKKLLQDLLELDGDTKTRIENNSYDETSNWISNSFKEV